LKWRLHWHDSEEALTAATRPGGQIMQLPDELGQLKAGYPADLVPVE